MKIVLSKFNECCFYISFQENAKEIEQGIWCPQSGMVVINGECAGFCSTKEEVITTLKAVKVTKYRIIDT